MGRDVRTVGIDLGGSNIEAIVWDGFVVEGHGKLDTPRGEGRDGVIDAVVAVADDAIDDADLDRDDIHAVGMGTPGAVVDGTVGGSANVEGFEERFDIRELLSERFDLPVAVTNDVTAAAVGEHRHGAGQGVEDLFVVFAGTGVGAGLVLDGKPYEGAHGAAGEFGHVVVELDGPPTPDGRRGTVEGALGKLALYTTMQRRVAAGEDTVFFDIMEEQGRDWPGSSTFLEAVERADPMVVDLVEHGLRVLGAGLAGVVNLLDVERILIGGGMGDKLGDWLVTRVEAAMAPALFLQPPRVEVQLCGLGDEGPTIGAASLAMDLLQER